MKTKLVKIDSYLWRIWNYDKHSYMGINCQKKSMPIILSSSELSSAVESTDSALPQIRRLDELSPLERKTAIQRYTVIAGVLSVVSEIKLRNEAIIQMYLFLFPYTL